MPAFERWRETWRRLRAIPPGVEVFDELIARYSEPHRAYHTLQHLDECFDKLRELERDAAHLGEIEVALWFHDAIYEVRQKDNEARSADWALAVAIAAGVAADAAKRIHALVMCTVHDAVPSEEDQRILVDVDLSILGADEPRFQEYERQIRQEYAWVPEDVFRARRGQVLAQFLARPSIFSTTAFRERYEGRARSNLERSLRALEQQ